MTYVAFLRGVNVGGKGIVSMAAIKEALVDLGLSDVRTYINSGNVIFSTRASNAQQVTARIEKALEQHTGMAIKVLVMDHKTLKGIVDAIPRNWVDDKTMRTYVLLLWKELDDRRILDRLPIKPDVDELRYNAWGCRLALRSRERGQEPDEQNRRHAPVQEDDHPQREHDAQAQRADRDTHAAALGKLK